MLSFFRKYQKIFFLFTTVMVVISFTFFGTFSTIFSGSGAGEKDYPVAYAVDHSPITAHQVERMSHFLSNGFNESWAGRKGKAPNLFNDGVMEKDILRSGVAQLLVEKYHSHFRFDLESKLLKAITHRPYRHPHASQVSAESAWQYISPSAAPLVNRIRNSGALLSGDTFASYVQAYLLQAQASPSFLQRVLQYQESQMSASKQDPELAYADLSLFGLHSSEEWFGEQFLQVMSQFILNAAVIAEQKGIHVTKEEAKRSLLDNLQDNMRAYAQQGTTFTAQQVKQIYAQQLRVIGLDENTCVALWQKVLLCRKLISTAGQAALLDPLLFSEFNSFAKQAAHVELYELPEMCKLKNFSSFMKMQIYVDAVSSPKGKKTPASFPSFLLSEEEIEKSCPELVQKSYVVEYSEIQREDLLSQLKLKDLWQWQTEEKNWSQVSKQCPSLAKEVATTADARFALLEKIVNKEERLALDHFTREKILSQQSDRIAQALAVVPKKRSDLHLSSRGGHCPFLGIRNQGALIALLDVAPLQGTTALSSSSLEAENILSCFSGDQSHFYSIQVVERESGKKVLTLAEAEEEGVLDALLNKKLEEVYPEVRKKETASFQAKDGSWLPIEKVKDKVGKHLFASVLKAVEQEYTSYKGELPTKEQLQTLEFYCTYRCLSWMREAKQALEKQKEVERWIEVPLAPSEQEVSSFKNDYTRQWLLHVSSKEVLRGNKDFFPSESLFSLAEGSLSPILPKYPGELLFYRMQKRGGAQSTSYEQVTKAQYLLSQEMQRQFLQKIISTMEEGQVFCFDLIHSGKN